ncbi:hypothetical protein PFISCL1PPCAC_3857, partial [Pristionchus fissidentatus]
NGNNGNLDYSWKKGQSANFWRFKRLEIDVKVFDGKLIKKMLEDRLNSYGTDGAWQILVTSGRLEYFEEQFVNPNRSYAKYT